MAAVIWDPIKDCLLQGRMPQNLTKFSNDWLLEYFVEVKDDVRALKGDSFQMFMRGHVQNIEVREDKVAKKSLIRAEVLPSMRTDRKYKALVILNETKICQTSCNCPSGMGPLASCKHLAALCYACEDFVKCFSRAEMDEACTERLNQWNRPKPKKTEPIPTYELPLEKQRHGQNIVHKTGKHPSSYQLDVVCNSDVAAAKRLITDLQKFEEEQNRKVAFLQVCDIQTPVLSLSIQAPVGSIVDSLNDKIENIRKSEKTRLEKIDDVIAALRVSEEERDRIEQETRKQAGSHIWTRAREKRITASKCHSVISFTYRTSGKGLVNSILKPSARPIQTPAVQFGIEHEPDAIKKYVESRHVTTEECGLFISTEKGFLAATPDSIVTDPDGQKGLLEVKALPTFKDIEPFDAYKSPKYPVALNNNNPTLKKKNLYYHQVQLQLYCCKHFASFADFVILHVDVDKIHYERIYPDQEWIQTKIPKMEAFYKSKVADKLLE